MTMPALRSKPAAGLADVDVRVWSERHVEHAPDCVAEEVPVALVYNGEPHAVMMATPAALEDFACGFSVTEEIVEAAAEIAEIRVQALTGREGYQIDLRIPEARTQLLSGRRRNLEGRTGCGLCGAQTIDAAIRPPRRVAAGQRVGIGAIRRALSALSRQQPLNAATGATHAAAWATPDGALVAVREDVGRHNALDKLIGHLLRSDAELTRGFLLITSRASYEMVLKAAAVGMPIVVAISAPTAFAIRIAEEARLTLIGFARGSRQVVYSYPGRILDAGADAVMGSQP